MSDVQEAPAKLERSAWVKRVLKVELRQKAIDASIGRGTASAAPAEGDENAKARQSLVRRLGELNKSAIDFAALAPRRDYAALRDDIKAIQDLIGQGNWKDAHKQLTETQAYIDEATPDFTKLRSLREDIQRVTMKLDKAYAFLLPEDFETYDQLLLGLDQGANAAAIESGVAKLRKIEEEIDFLAKEGAQRLGRLATLQKQCLLAHPQTVRLGERADEFGLPELQSRASSLATELGQLASSTDEAALTEALAKAATLEDDSKEPFAQGETRRRASLLTDIGKRRDKLLADNQALIDGAVETLDEDLTEALQGLAERLQAAPDSDAVVDKAEDAFGLVEAAIDTLKSEMGGIAVLQQQMEPRLRKYPAMQANRDEDDADDELDDAYNALPEELRDPGAPGWATAAAWTQEHEWESWNFFKGWAKRLRNDADALEAEAYQDMLARKPNACRPFTDIQRKASPTDQVDGQNLLTQIGALVPGPDDDGRLTPADVNTLEGLFAALDALVVTATTNITAKGVAAAQTDAADGGHSVARHGPNITDAKLQSRLSTGRAPDGVFSPAAKSCRFNSYDDLIDTRTAAFADAASAAGLTVDTLFGASFDQAPDPGHVSAVRKRTSHVVSLDHAPRVIGGGFKGTTVKENFPLGGQSFSAMVALPPLTKTYTKIVWDAGKSRWVAAQHFPTDV